ncbi:hypothetical protein [Rhizobium leguminosarum]|uniref:hypothetical protein n=1 Tax=Rhizobium leguminosarum TaxID=384 RepID=UPI0013EE8FEC|nr:hypothetical protein [Rhizobium leguminosarum]
MKTRYSQAMWPSSAAPVIQSTTRYRPLRQGATLLSFQSQNSAVRKASARAWTSNRVEKKSFGNKGLFSQMIAPHHPSRHLPRVRFDACQTADSGNYYFFVI